LGLKRGGRWSGRGSGGSEDAVGLNETGWLVWFFAGEAGERCVKPGRDSEHPELWIKVGTVYNRAFGWWARVLPQTAPAGTSVSLELDTALNDSSRHLYPLRIQELILPTSHSHTYTSHLQLQRSYTSPPHTSYQYFNIPTTRAQRHVRICTTSW
jgi:hypothetical protein